VKTLRSRSFNLAPPEANGAHAQRSCLNVLDSQTAPLTGHKRSVVENNSGLQLLGRLRLTRLSSLLMNQPAS
jgi:hypothetical protein